MVIVVRNGSESGCEPDDRNVLAGSSPVFSPKIYHVSQKSKLGTDCCSENGNPRRV